MAAVAPHFLETSTVINAMTTCGLNLPDETIILLKSSWTNLQPAKISQTKIATMQSRRFPFIKYHKDKLICCQETSRRSKPSSSGPKTSLDLESIQQL